MPTTTTGVAPGSNATGFYALDPLERVRALSAVSEQFLKSFFRKAKRLGVREDADAEELASIACLRLVELLNSQPLKKSPAEPALLSYGNRVIDNEIKFGWKQGQRLQVVQAEERLTERQTDEAELELTGEYKPETGEPAARTLPLEESIREDLVEVMSEALVAIRDSMDKIFVRLKDEGVEGFDIFESIATGQATAAELARLHGYSADHARSRHHRIKKKIVDLVRADISHNLALSGPVKLEALRRLDKPGPGT